MGKKCPKLHRPSQFWFDVLTIFASYIRSGKNSTEFIPNFMSFDNITGISLPRRPGFVIERKMMVKYEIMSIVTTFTLD